MRLLITLEQLQNLEVKNSLNNSKVREVVVQRLFNQLLDSLVLDSTQVSSSLIELKYLQNQKVTKVFHGFLMVMDHLL